MEFIYEDNKKERLDKYLQTQLDITRSQIKKAILSGQVTVNAETSSVHHWLKNGDRILYQPKEEAKPTDFSVEPKIVRQTDEYLIFP